MRNRRLAAHDYVRIAAEGTVDPRTVRRIYEGERSSSTTRERVRQAAETLGLPPPPERRESEVA